MLVRFAVQNFRSFCEQTEISMVANGHLSRLKHHTMEFNAVKLLKGAYVYGANAAGKSNLIKAVDFACSLIKDGSADRLRYDQYNKVCERCSKEPGVFQFEILIDQKVYSYGFAFSYLDGTIAEEWLYELYSSGGERCIFSRDLKGNVTHGLNLSKLERTKFNVYAEGIDSLPKNLFLSEVARTKQKGQLTIFNDIFSWFEKVIVILPDSQFGSLPLILENEEMRKMFELHLPYFDTGIEGLKVERTTLERATSHLGGKAADILQKSFLQKLDKEKEFAVRIPGALLAFKRTDDGELHVDKLALQHGDAYETFELNEESDGTQRLFDLIPLLFLDLKNRVVFVDEIDRSMHPTLTAEFVSLFYKSTKNENVQLIATTHESSLLDLGKVRRDEIWFVERLNKGSKLFSLDDFKVRYDKQIEKDYLLGRYGAIPLFSSFDSFQEGDDFND